MISKEIEKMEKEKNQASATPQEAPAAGTGTKKVGGGKVSPFSMKGAAIRQKMTDDEKAIEGSMSAKVAFVCALGDPNKNQSRQAKKEAVPSKTVVGYKVKLLEDMEVPEAPLKADWKDLIDYDGTKKTMIPHKAGEVVALNIPEMAMFITDSKFAGKFTGEGRVVSIGGASSESRQIPFPILKLLGGGSVKENMEMIADMIGTENGSKGTPKIKPEYAEKFGMIYNKISMKKTSAKKSGGSEASANLAAAFRSYFADRDADKVK